MAEKKKEWPPYAPGTQVRESDIRDRKITYTWWEPEVQYSWSLGQAMSKFLQGLKEAKIQYRVDGTGGGYKEMAICYPPY